MPQGYTITPQPQAGQQGPAWIRWLERYAQEHAAAVAQVAVRDFPPMVRERLAYHPGRMEAVRLLALESGQIMCSLHAPQICLTRSANAYRS